MKKIVLLFTVLVLFAGCKHRKAIRVEDETPQNSEESFVLHPTIMAAIKEFGLSNHTDRIYAVYFTDTNDGFTMLKQDTLIYLSFLEETPLIDANYKGILDIDSLSVAIFDKNSCGNKKKIYFTNVIRQRYSRYNSKSSRFLAFIASK